MRQSQGGFASWLQWWGPAILKRQQTNSEIAKVLVEDIRINHEKSRTGIDGDHHQSPYNGLRWRNSREDSEKHAERNCGHESNDDPIQHSSPRIGPPDSHSAGKSGGQSLCVRTDSA